MWEKVGRRKGAGEEGAGEGEGEGGRGRGEGCEVCPWPTASLSHFTCVWGPVTQRVSE
jgi:hypothetical protein